MKKFKINIEQHQIDDLHQRLDNVRWPNEAKADPWQYGTDLNWMQTVAEYWRHEYDWRKWEAQLNQYDHFLTDIDGLNIHFIKHTGSGSNPLPLLLTHGWPGSIVEFLDVIDKLAHPEKYGGNIEDAFTVILPSLPGYGFSDSPSAPINPTQIACIWSKLMVEKLGYKKYVAQGGDWGGIVTANLALHYPQNLSAIHLNIAALHPSPNPKNPLTEQEKNWRKADAKRRAELTGYSLVQATRPQTLAYGLTDSPIGLAAWILEKFHDWTIRGQDAPPPFNLDHLLTNVMLYWFKGINSANWLYASMFNSDGRLLPIGEYVDVPTGFMLCPEDLGERPPNKLA